MIGPVMEQKVKDFARVHAFRFGCKGHPQLDDIISEGVLGALGALSRVPEHERDGAGALAWVASKEAIINFLRSRQNLTRRQFASGAPTPEIYSIDAWMLDGEEPRYYRSEDFAPAVIHKLYLAWFWNEFWAAVYPAERPLVIAWLGDESIAAAARGDGCSKSYYTQRLNRVFNRIRRRYGVKETDANTIGSNYIDPALLKLSPEDEDLRMAAEWLLNKQGWVYCRTPKKRGGGKNLLIRLIAARMETITPGTSYRPENGDSMDLRRENLVMTTRNDQNKAYLAARRAKDPEAFLAKRREQYHNAREKRREAANARWRRNKERRVAEEEEG